MRLILHAHRTLFEHLLGRNGCRDPVYGPYVYDQYPPNLGLGSGLRLQGLRQRWAGAGVDWRFVVGLVAWCVRGYEKCTPLALAPRAKSKFMERSCPQLVLR
jgi:hypothetical protein